MPDTPSFSDAAAQPLSARPSAAYRRGLRDALGAPSLVLFASYLGFGALVRSSGLEVVHGLFSTATGWALPGQIILIELYAAGAPLLAIVAAVALTNARLLPMTVALMPMLRSPRWPNWLYYLAAHWIAVTGWAAALKACPSQSRVERLPYFLGFSTTLWTTTFAATGLGFWLAGSVPPLVSLGLVFLNPLYFMLIFAGDVPTRLRLYALVLGAMAGPAFHLLDPDYGLLLAGIVAGTMAFLLGRGHRSSPKAAP
ncbi:AzlC family ABC transporter permease [Algihabitans albus]|uniref:AzlC family ABC transporter permease n=1 Tax=Algihabitans albus TaxID=2164067 RepID=UPI000E5C7294|nr:AzlC family ABC transporter permease [Algihabitans albus]